MTDDPVLAAAVRWHSEIRSERVDWDAFVAWLEAAPAHREAYDTISLVETMAGPDADDGRMGMPDAAAPRAAANDDTPTAAPRRIARRLAIAGFAGLAAAVALGLVLLPQQSAQSQWQTGDDARIVAFADGVTIALAPHSRLTRSGNRLGLDGDAVFSVVHRPDRPLTIAAGDLAITDIGTHFDLRVDPATVRLALDEGRVSVSGDQLEGPLPLAVGQALVFDRATGTLALGTAGDGTVGDWQHDQLTYHDAPLSLVANDITRYGRVSLRVSGAEAQLRFSGTLRLGPGHDPALELARVMALRLDRTGHDAVLRRPGPGTGARSD